MVEVLYDVQLAQAIYSDYNAKMDTPEKKQALINDVLQKHKITQANLDSSMLWYSDNIKLYMEINDSVASRLKSSRDGINERIRLRTIAQNHDILPPLYYLEDLTPLLSFRIDSAKLKSINPAMFKWSFDAMGISAHDTIMAAAYFTYQDTVIKEITPVTENRYYAFSKPQLPDSLLKNVSGYIHLQNNSPSRIFIYNISYLDSIHSTVSDPSKQMEMEVNKEIPIQPPVESQQSVALPRGEREALVKQVQ